MPDIDDTCFQIDVRDNDRRVFAKWNYLCSKCGAMVGVLNDRNIHAEWHAELEARFAAAALGRRIDWLGED